METPPKKKKFPFLRTRWVVLIGIIAAGAAVWTWARPAAQDSRFAASFTAKKGDLEITVVEGGSLEAQEKVEVKSEVEGQTKILSLVEEGYFVTPEDVESMKVLVELDATEIRERQTQQELQYQNAYAAHAQAREAFSIQINQNDSDTMAGELEVKFARMDFERYVGKDVADEIVAQLDSLNLLQDEDDARAENAEADAPKAVSSEEESTPEATPVASPASDTAVNALPPLNLSLTAAEKWPIIDFEKYADVNRLGNGEAGQKLRKLEDDLVLNQKELALSESKLDGTKRLFTKEFVTKNDLEQDEMAVKRNSIQLDSSTTAKDLFLKYEFHKMAEKLMADYIQATRKLTRTRQLAISKLAQAEAQLRSAEANYELQATQRKKIQEQVEKCTIRATKPGLVVYGGGGDRWWDNEHIEEGATVRERQVIITIPDTTRMAVEANIHEAYVKLVNKGQKVRVRADANRDRLLTGEVAKIGVLPNSENRWMSPDVKVYETKINIDGSHDWLKPGMSAQVEIVAGVLEDVVHVPVEAVFNEGGKRVCYVKGLTGADRRDVETGEFNDSYIEIKTGVEEGDVVMLRSPEEGKSTEDASDQKKGEKKDKPEGGDAKPQAMNTPSRRGHAA
jgi:HlyD family secretion protein